MIFYWCTIRLLMETNSCTRLKAKASFKRFQGRSRGHTRLIAIKSCLKRKNIYVYIWGNCSEFVHTSTFPTKLHINISQHTRSRKSMHSPGACQFPMGRCAFRKSEKSMPNNSNHHGTPVVRNDIPKRFFEDFGIMKHHEDDIATYI